LASVFFFHLRSRARCHLKISSPPVPLELKSPRLFRLQLLLLAVYPGSLARFGNVGTVLYTGPFFFSFFFLLSPPVRQDVRRFHPSVTRPKKPPPPVFLVLRINGYWNWRHSDFSSPSGHEYVALQLPDELVAVFSVSQ